MYMLWPKNYTRSLKNGIIRQFQKNQAQHCFSAIDSLSFDSEIPISTENRPTPPESSKIKAIHTAASLIV